MDSILPSMALWVEEKTWVFVKGMSMDDINLISARNFEEYVMAIITYLLHEDEPIELEHKVGSTGLRIDIYLEKGCKRLSLPSKTLIEIKYLLRLDTLSKVAFQFKEAIDKGGYSKFIIICKEKLFDAGILRNDYELQGRTEIWTFKDLREKAQIIDEEAPIVAISDSKNVSAPDLIDLAKDTAAHDKITLFLGAGVSMDANLPSWNNLLEALLVKKNNSPFEYINEANSESISTCLANSSIVAGRYIMEGYRAAVKRQYGDKKSELEVEEITRNEVVGRMRTVLYRNQNKNNNSDLVKALASIASEKNVKQLITYNYDDLIEFNLSDTDKFVSVYDETVTHMNGLKPIYHVHGYIPRDKTIPGTPVLSEREYHKLYSRMHHWANVVQLNALYTTTCFFVGFSMTDPNQRRLLDLARNVDLGSIEVGNAQHYIFLRRQNLKGEAVKAVNEEHCKEIENMMFELGLNVIWFDEFENLPKCLSYIFGKTDEKPKMKF